MKLFGYTPVTETAFTPLPCEPAASEPSGPHAVTASLEANLKALNRMLNNPPNDDVTIRRVRLGSRDAAIINIEGMTSRDVVSDFIMRPLLLDTRLTDCADGELMDFISHEILTTVTCDTITDLSKVCAELVSGSCALLVNGGEAAIIVEARGFEKRSIGTPEVENVILGPHEAFTESFRTSVTQVRRLLRTGKLVTELFHIGTEAPTTVALMYLSNVANPALVEEGRRRLRGIDYDFVPGAGYLQQLLEDDPAALVPQLTMTERPDRVAFGLIEGQIAFVCDAAPFALTAPSSIWNLIHASDDAFMRWPAGTFMRIVRTFGLLLSLLLPAVYIAVIQFHTEILPVELLMSIAAANASVPFPMLLEVLLMELSFDLIQEAGTRVPGTLGSAMGIIGALILGQAAVSAGIVSPILIIIVAMTGLGNYSISDYGLSVTVRILRLMLLLISATMGFLGLSAAVFVMVASASTLTSFGVPWLSPFAPKDASNRDLLIRMPLWMQRKRPGSMRARFASRAGQRVRKWDAKERKP